MSPKFQARSYDRPLTFILLGSISPASDPRRVGEPREVAFTVAVSKVVGEIGDKLHKETITKMV